MTTINKTANIVDALDLAKQIKERADDDHTRYDLVVQIDLLVARYSSCCAIGVKVWPDDVCDAAGSYANIRRNDCKRCA